MITRMSHTTIFVLDQAKAIDVYVNKLGFKVSADMVMDNGFRWLTMNAPQAPDLEILIAEPNPAMFDAEQIAALRTLLEKNVMGAGVFECDDCKVTYEKMKARGVEFLKEPTKEFYGMEAIFKDGCGNWFSLTEKTAGA